MAWTGISNSALQYAKNAGGAAASGYYLKAYASGTTTPILFATDSTGGTTLAKSEIGTLGYPLNGSDAIFIPHVDQDYKLALYTNETDADNNTFANAAWVIDAIKQSDNGLRADLIASQGTSLITHTESGTDYNLETYLQNRYVANVLDFGAVGDNVTDDSTVIQSALDSGASVVCFPEPSSGRYKIDTGLNPPNGVMLIGAGTTATRLRYTGLATAVNFGESASVLNKGCAIQRMKIELEDKGSRALYFRGTEKAIAKDIEIEGLYTPYDNTRSNIGIQVDGANISSFFNRFEDIKSNHINQSYVIQTTGTLQSTNNYFLNCSAFGDQSTDDSSYGYRIGDGGSVIQEGQGTVISGGNVEKCNTCFKIGNNAGNITIVGTRTEITPTATAWRFDFVDGCDPCTLINIQGMGNSYMEANSGIRNWDSANHTLIGDDNGSLRLAGYDGPLNNTQFIGIGGTNPEFRHEANSELYIYSDGDNTDTGRTLIQQGFGSAAHGGHIDLSGTAHPTRPGDCTLGPSSTTGDFKVNHGLNGATQLQVDRSSTAGETRLLIYDVDNATLERVSVGAADSGGSGFKVLRIPN